MKGLPIYAVAVNEILSIWFSSPTGDSSDSYVYNITCSNESQAQQLAEAYRQIINGESIITTGDEATEERLDNLRQTIHEYKQWEEAHIHEISELKEKLDMYKLAYDSQRLIIANLQEQLKASEQWFDKTVRF